jgi:hypothetical protein
MELMVQPEHKDLLALLALLALLELLVQLDHKDLLEPTAQEL